MKRIAVLTFLSAPAFAHQVAPQTKFFQEQIQKNPMIQNVLTWCSLIGLDKEEDCKNEMYKNSDIIDPVRLEAATKCVDKSGLKYRVAFDDFFKSNLNGSNFVSSTDINGDKHLYPTKGPKGTEWEKEHYHYFTAVDKQESAMIQGDRFVDSFKKWHSETVTLTKEAGEITVGAKVELAKIYEASGQLKGVLEQSVTRGSITTEDLRTAGTIGQNYGRAHPESTGRQPSGSCFVAGNCTQIDKQFPESQLQAEVSKDVLPKLSEEKPAPVSSLVPDPLNRDPFAPFTSETATGGIPTEPKEKPKNPESTPVDPKVFVANLNDCASQEEQKIYDEMGTKTTDPDAKSDEQKKEDAERDLADGFCDSVFFGADFCSAWERELQETKDEDAEAKEQAKRDHAMKQLEQGLCDSAVLGEQFCKAYYEAMVTTEVETELETPGIDDVAPPDTNPIPEGGHVPVDSHGDPWSPEDGHKAD